MTSRLSTVTQWRFDLIRTEQEIELIVSEISGTWVKRRNARKKLAEESNKEVYEKMSEVKSLDNELNNKIKSLVHDAKFYEENDQCPSCDQPITEVIKDDKISKIKSNAADVQSEMENLRKEIRTTEQEGQTIANHLNELRQRQQKINANNEKIALLQREIDKVQKEINTLKENGVYPTILWN